MRPRFAAGLILGLLLVCTMTAGAPAATGGSLDTTFNPTGTPPGSVIAAMAPGTGADYFWDTAIQKDGKIVVAGEAEMGANGTDVALARYNQNGTLDATFDTDGKATTDFSGTGGNDRAYAMLIQPDGKIVAAGMANTTGGDDDFGLARYNTDGSLDTAFGTGGLVTTSVAPGTNKDYAFAVAIQPDGKLVVAGGANVGGATGWDSVVVRYNSDGTLDPAFGTGGKVVSAVSPGTDTDWWGSVAIQPDGKIVLAGKAGPAANTTMSFARLTSTGAADTSFGTAGFAMVDFPSGGQDGNWLGGLAVQPDGKIVSGGYASGEVAVARLNSNGTIDTTFNSTGTATASLGGSTDQRGHDATLQTDGRIVIAADVFVGGIWTLGAARFNSDGTLDTTFDGDGKVLTPVGDGTGSDAYSVALQRDGQIVVSGDAHTAAGEYDSALVRYNLGTYLYRSDAIINARGDDVYWQGQSAKVKVAEGTSKTVTIRVQNDGTSADRFMIHGSNSKGKARSAFAVSYWMGSRNITREVTGGTYVTASVASGGAVTIAMKITALGPSGHRTFNVTATSHGYAGSVDTVQAVVSIS